MATKPQPRKATTQRKPASQRRAMVASATRIRIDQREEVKKALALKEKWQELAWDYYDAVEPVKFGTNVLANVLSKLRLFAAVEPDDADAEPVADDNFDAVDTVDRLRGETGGHAEVLRSLGVNLSVPGTCWLVGLAPRQTEDGEPTPERWFIASTEEVKVKNNRAAVEDPDTGADIVLRGKADVGEGEEPDFWARIWRRHQRKASKADSSLRGVLSACEELLIVDRAFRSIERSRVPFGKILYIPDDISFGNTDPTTDNAGDGEALDDPFNQELLEAFTTPIQDEGSAGAVAPVFLRGPRKDGGSGIEVISIDRSGDEMLHKRGEDALRRIARGLDLPPELYFGLSEATHWGAGQIEKQEFRQHVEPLAILCVDALTVAYHRPALRALGMGEDEVARRRVWFDASAVVIDPVQQASADGGHDRLVLSDDAWRRIKGFGEDDAPTPEEVQRRILQDAARRGSQGPGGNDLPSSNGNGSAPSEPVIAAAVGAELGRRLTDIDRALKTRLESALDASLRRALQKVGSHLRRTAQRDDRLASLVDSVPNEDVVATLGPAHVSSLGGIPQATLTGVIEEMRRRFDAWTRTAQRQALALVPRMESAERQIVEDTQATDREDAWRWLRQAMIDLAHERLYDPNPEADEEGEVDADVSVPFDIVREAVARAGGAGHGEVRTAAVLDLPRLPLLDLIFGIATGPVLRRSMREHGVRTEGFVWEYGNYPRTRPFEPHRRLDGEPFGNFDDETLRNPRGGFPGEFFLPGDHGGCKCDAIPSLVDVSQT